jgi:hypothetical protein
VSRRGREARLVWIPQVGAPEARQQRCARQTDQHELEQVTRRFAEHGEAEYRISLGHATDSTRLLILSNTLQNAILGDDTTWTGGLIRASTLLIVNAVDVRIMVRDGRLDDAIESHEDSLITDGVIQSDVNGTGANDWVLTHTVKAPGGDR